MAPESELVSTALQSFLRGGTFPGLAREVAWTAARSAGASAACLDWLTPLVSQPLARGLEGLEFQVDRASAAAREEHLRAWPHDLVGADLAARLAGEEEATRALTSLRAEVVKWATELLEDRLLAEDRRRRRAA
jgi:hypothetical protein